MSDSADRVQLLARFEPTAPMFSQRGEVRSQAQWLADVEACAAALPVGALLLNLCLNRYAFMVSFVAALRRGCSNVLAGDPSSATVQRLRERMPALRALGDDATRADLDLLFAAPLGEHVASAARNHEIAGALQAALPFTSGSTGEPQSHPKRFFAMRLTADATEQRLFARWPRYSVLATVPSQHMYGLETTLMLALGGRALVACEHPLLPGDIARALAALPRPRVLVTTPIHLRALARTAGDFPALDLVVSATAPLGAELAAGIETRLRCEVHEIYGCTEAGSLATRRTLDGDVWTLLGDYRIAPDAALDGSEQRAQVSGPQVAGPVLLPDRIECVDSQRFRLLGRQQDMVNVAGKRASLAQLNHLLLQQEGVLDGLIWVPAEATAENARLQGMVVTDGRSEREVLKQLASQVDAVFLPRPLQRVDAIPRNTTGKVPIAALHGAVLQTAVTPAAQQFEVHVAADGRWFDAHFPDRPIVPGVVLLQALQDACMRSDPLLRELLEVRQVRFLAAITAPLTLVATAELRGEWLHCAMHRQPELGNVETQVPVLRAQLRFARAGM